MSLRPSRPWASGSAWEFWGLWCDQEGIEAGAQHPKARGRRGLVPGPGVGVEWGARTPRCPHRCVCEAAGILGLVAPGVLARRRATLGAPSVSASPAPLHSVHRSTARSPALPLLTHPQRGGMVFNNVAFWGLNHCTEDEDGGRINSPRLPARPPPGLGQAACSFRRQFVALGCSGCFSKQRSELGFSVHPGEQRAGERGAGGSCALPDGRRGVPDLSAGSAGFPGLGGTHGVAAAAHCGLRGALSPGPPRPGPQHGHRGLGAGSCQRARGGHAPASVSLLTPQLPLGTDARGPAAHPATG